MVASDYHDDMQAKPTTDKNDDLNDNFIGDNNKTRSLFTDSSLPTLILGAQSNKQFTGSLTHDFSVQCENFEEKDAGCQVILRAECGVQTDSEVATNYGKKKKKSDEGKEGEGKSGEGEPDNNFSVEDIDNSELQRIAKFLRAVTGPMIDELNSNICSTAFSNYNVSEKKEQFPSSYLFSLSFASSAVRKQIKDMNSTTRFGVDNNYLGEEEDRGLSVTDVAFSAGGTTVCASFGLAETQGWCNEKGFLCSWNLSDRAFLQDTPTKQVEWSSYVTCVVGHPEKPSIFCAGSFNGEIFVVDWNEDSPLIASSKIDDYFHREPIKSLSWTWDSNDHDYHLTSVSGDGKILWWQIEKMKCPMRGIRLSAKMGERGERGKQVIGGTAMTSGGKNADQIYVGSEGGALFRIASRDFVPAKPSKSSDLEMKWSTSALQALSRVPMAQREETARQIERKAKKDKRRGVDLAAVYNAKIEPHLLFPNKTDFAYQPHIGPVISVDISPFNPRLFASGGSDGELRLFETLNKQPIMSYEPCADSGGSIQSVCFSKTRPGVIGCADNQGIVSIYDLLQESASPVAELNPVNGIIDKNRLVEDEERDREDEQDAIIHNEKSNFSTVYGESGFSCKLTCLAFSHGNQRKIIVAGDERGVVHVWRLPNELSDKMPEEEELLSKKVEKLT